jgi:hypothetical protein
MNQKNLISISFTILFACLQWVSLAQIHRPTIFVETDLMVSAGKFAPFWAISNKYGIFSTENNVALLRTGVESKTDTTRNISYGYGLDAIYRYDSKSKIWFQQAYAEGKLFFLLLKGGLFEETFGSQDNQLSTGNYLWSGNARTMPKIALYTNDYILVPFTFDFLEVKTGISHGWFGEKDQYVRNAYLHQKYLYFRIGEKKLPISVNFGIHHTAMWGGVSPDTTRGDLPSDFNAFKSVLIPRIGGDQGPVEEQINVLGNHLASYSLGVDYNVKKFKFSLYWNTFLDDKNGRVGVDWKNRTDGLWGLVISRKDSSAFLQKIVLEFFNSTNQSGDPSLSGNDDYFNNYLYRSGWTYRKMTIGTPLITSPVYTNRVPEMKNYLDNNSLTAFNAGVLCRINDKYLSVKLTYSLNYGTIVIPFEKTRPQLYSSIVYSYCSKRYQNLFISWQGAFDIGTHVGNNAGILVSARKTF